ncbi:MAG: hypothetical protein L3K01_03785 [Thermoplasmata archaeon]|nr:hypothetical protein [Thermoplasmata archaeon]
MGSVPSSRLTKILQEKAESLKKRRQLADQASAEVEDRLKLLEEIGVVLSETAERAGRLRELTRKSDWEAVEQTAREFVAYIQRSVAPALEERRASVIARAEALQHAKAPLPVDATALVDELRATSTETELALAVERIASLFRIVRQSQTDFSLVLRERARAVAKWAGIPDERMSELDGRFRQALAPMTEGKVDEAIGRLDAEVRGQVPAAVERRELVRASGLSILGAARDLGSQHATLDTALAVDQTASPLEWSESVPAIERASADVGEELRGRVQGALGTLKGTLEALRTSGTDVTEGIAQIEVLADQVPGASPVELPQLLAKARGVTEEPVVNIVAGLLDEVRPKLVEARWLGRDASDVFAAMNRAREALRLKIYGEALAASQEAMDRATALTEDLDAAREEVDSLRSLLDRLSALDVPVQPYLEPLREAQTRLEKFEVDAARATIRETIRTLGRSALEHFQAYAERLAKVVDIARERGFLPTETADALANAQQTLADGSLAEAGEELAAVEVQLRAAAGPYVTRVVEGLEKGFEEIHDDSLVAPARRFLADADVSLRVKEDLPASLESLKRAEREFAAVFAAHASSLVEALEEEGRALEAMGGAGDEIQRQIDEVQQIFNMGDFVKASRASQEIRTRAQQQQLIQSEEAVSHAKLALVELGKMGLDTAGLRDRFDAAQEAARDHRFAEAYQGAKAVEEEALGMRQSAEALVEGLQRAGELWQGLKDDGVAVDAYRERIRETRLAYQALDFSGAKGKLRAIEEALASERAATDAGRRITTVELLLEDAQRLGLTTDPYRPNLATAGAALAEGRPVEALQLSTATQDALLQILRPVLEETVRALEQELDVARSAGVDTGTVVEQLAEARRGMAAPVPTGVAERVESVRAQLVETRGFLEQAERAVKRAREAYGEAEIVRATIGPLKARLVALEGHLTEKRYARAIELGGPLERELIQSTHTHVARTLANLQGTLVHVRQEGSPTTVAENLLSRARQALEEGRAIEALTLAAQSEGEIERVELQTSLARAALETMEAKLVEAGRDGIRAPAATGQMEKARHAFGRQQFPSVFELALEAVDQLALSREQQRRTRDALDSADRQVKEALELGADIDEVVRTLDRARHLAQAGEYPSATQTARESGDMARWAIERLYAGSFASIRSLVETMTVAGTGRVPAVDEAVAEAEGAIPAREWKRASDALERARTAANETLDRLLDARRSDLEALYGAVAVSGGPEAEARAQAALGIQEAREQRDYALAVQRLSEEEGRARLSRIGVLERAVHELKERLWVGEKLGLDTTPVMELFSEAKIALEAGKYASVEANVQQGNERLAGLVDARLGERRRSVESELVFAREGLNVTLGTLPERLASVEGLVKSGELVEGARTLLAVEAELNTRKALHRELLNIHYLIDSALSKAAEKHVDTTDARKLLEESIRARVDDYQKALDKARESLKLLQGQSKPPETTAAFWPFRRQPF